MGSLKAYDDEVLSVFQLIGYKENDITKSIAWAFHKCPALLKTIVYDILEIEIDPETVDIYYQKYEAENGITDIEMTDHKNFYVIIEAKRGWILPGEEQLNRYSLRESITKAEVKHKAIISMSECSNGYASINLRPTIANGIPIKHLSWRKIYDLANKSKEQSNNAQKRLLEELLIYLGGVMTMQTKDSNWVYVVSLGSGNPEGCSISWIDIVNKCGRYFHPVGGKGWPKEPPNYIAFRYDGKLQSIHHIEDYVVSKNMHDEIKEMPDEEWDNHFVYKLGPAIKPPKEVKTGNIYPSGRVWAMIDTLFTSETISDARDISKERKELKKQH